MITRNDFINNLNHNLKNQRFRQKYIVVPEGYSFFNRFLPYELEMKIEFLEDQYKLHKTEFIKEELFKTKGKLELVKQYDQVFR